MLTICENPHFLFVLQGLRILKFVGYVSFGKGNHLVATNHLVSRVKGAFVSDFASSLRYIWGHDGPP